MSAADLRDALQALGWGPVHLWLLACGLWRVEIGGRAAVGATAEAAIAALLVQAAAGDA